MTPDTRQRVEELLDRALDLGPDERQAFLAKSCGDAQVRAEVESLLAHHQRADQVGLLKTAAAGPILHVPSHASSTESMPSAIGPYRVLNLVGEGGFGAIYLGVRDDGQYQVKVAIKVLKRGLDTEDILRRFLRERQTLAGLQRHPNIVTLFDGGSTPDGRPYFIMEYVDGKPLDKYCDQHRASIDERLRIFLTVCSAVQHAHNNLLIHRDLKPANILVTGRDNKGQCGVKLLDFGIAKLLNPEISSETMNPTTPWQRFMTPEYASPEQVRGERIDVTSDVYSLGVILYELLTGHLPYRFKRTPADIERVIGEQDPETPSTKVTKVEEVTKEDGTTLRITPETVSACRDGNPMKLKRRLAGDLDNIVMQALKKDPQQRYRSVHEFAEDVQNHLDGNPVKARGSPRGYRAAKFLRKHKGKLSVAAAAFLALAGVAAWALLERSHAFAATRLAVSEKEKADELRKQAEKATAEAKRQSERAEQNAYLARMRLVGRAWADADLHLAAKLLALYQPGADLERYRGFEWHYYWRLVHGDVVTWTDHRDRITCAALSPDGRLLASADMDNKVKLRDSVTGNVLRVLTPTPYKTSCLAFTHDGKVLATGSASGLIDLWDVGSGEKIDWLQHTRNAAVKSIAFLPDGQRLISAGADGAVKLWDLRTGKYALRILGDPASLSLTTIHPGMLGVPNAIPQAVLAAGCRITRPTAEVCWRIPTLGQNIGGVALSPGGDSLAIAIVRSQDSEIQLFNLATRQVVAVLEARDLDGRVASLAFSSDGATVAAGTDGRTVILWEHAMGKRRVLHGHRGPVWQVAFSSDGQRVVTAGADRTIKVWSVSGQELATFRGHQGEVTSLALATDGVTLVTGSTDHTLKRWDLSREQERTVLGSHGKLVHAVAFARDNSTLVSGGMDGRIRVWNALTRELLDSLEAHRGAVRCLSLSPDGKMLATGGDDKTVKLWDLADRKLLATLEGHTDLVLCVAFAPDGKTLASAGVDGSIVLWDVETRKQTGTLRERPLSIVRSIAFSPDGQTLVSGHENRMVHSWTVANRERVATLKGHKDDVQAVAFSRDGKILASASLDRTVRLWNPATHESLALLEHSSPVWSVTFTPDGGTLAAASGEEVKLWDVATHEDRATLRGVAKRAIAVCFAPNGKCLAVGCSDGTILQWQAASDDEVRAALESPSRRQASSPAAP